MKKEINRYYIMSNLPVKLMKIPSEYSGTLTATGTRNIDFHVPEALGFVDLDNAYLLLRMGADTATGQDPTSLPTAIRPVAFGAGADRPKYDPDVLVRNAYMEASRVGRLEDHNDCNLINQTLHFHERAGEDLQSNTLFDGTFETDEYGRVRSNFRDIRYLEASGDSFSGYSLTGGATGENRPPVLNPEIRIPLKSVCKMADGLDMFPVAAVGDLHLHCELEDQTHELMEVDSGGDLLNLKGVDNSGVAVNEFYLSQHYYDANQIPLWGGQGVSILGGADVSNPIQSVTTYTIPADYTATVGTYADLSGAQVTGGSGTGAVFTVTVADGDPYDTNPVTVALDASGDGYLATDTLVIPGTHWGSDASLYLDVRTTGPGIGSGVNANITGLVHNADGVPGQVKVTLSDSIPAGPANQTLNNLILIPVSTDGTADWSVIEANLVVPQLMMNKGMQQQYQQELAKGIDIDYMVWDVEAANQDSGSRFNRQFTLPPMTGNVIAVTPRDNLLFPNRDNASTFRWKLNGEYTTDNAIAQKSPLYYDRVQDTFNNMGKQLKNMDCLYRADTNRFFTASAEPMIMPQPVPLMPEQSMLDLEVYASPNLTQGNIYCYKQKRRTLKLNNNGVELMN